MTQTFQVQPACKEVVEDIRRTYCYSDNVYGENNIAVINGIVCFWRDTHTENIWHYVGGREGYVYMGDTMIYQAFKIWIASFKNLMDFKDYLNSL